MSEQIGWLCFTDNGCRHFIWKADDADEQAWLDKHYPRREPVYTGKPAPEEERIERETIAKNAYNVALEEAAEFFDRHDSARFGWTADLPEIARQLRSMKLEHSQLPQRDEP